MAKAQVGIDPRSLAQGNVLLAALLPTEFEEIAPDLEPESMKLLKTLYEPYAIITYAYFLTCGLASIIADVHDGGNVEVGICGREGFLGGSIMLGVDRTPNRVFMQVAGEALRIRADALVLAAGRSDGLRKALNKAIYVHMLQVTQSAACNRVHDVRERLARWLLMSQDRSDGEILTLTHEFLALMLGVRRSSVTVAAGILQSAGLIEYRHGNIRIKDRKGLESASCDCYSIVKREHDRLSPGLANRPDNN